MPKGSDNPFPSILFVEGTTPSTPSSGDQRLFVRSSDHVLCYVNSSGTVTPVSSGSSGAQAAHGTRVTRASGNFSVGNNTLTAVACTAEDYDTNAMHDNTTNNSRITIPSISGVTTGLWAIKGSCYTDQAIADIIFRINGSTNIGFIRMGNSSLGAVALAIDWVFTAADYIEMMVRTPLGAGNVSFDAGVSPLFEVAFMGKVT